MSIIAVIRLSVEDSGVYGHADIDWDTFGFVTLENPALDIPTGTYSLVWHVSPHLNNETVPMLVDVPGRTEILIHEGNWDTCSEGCVLVGAIRDGNAIDCSKGTLATLIQKINDIGIENVQITIS